RYVFVSTGLLLAMASFRFTSCETGAVEFRVSFRRMLLVLAAAAAGIAALMSYLPDNRIDQLVTVAADQDLTVEDVGTFAWRYAIYQDIWSNLQKRGRTELLFGSGTCSGAALMVERDPEHHDLQDIDGNRSLHSEILRALYEWGIFGLALLLFFLTATIWGFARKVAAQHGGPALAFIGALPSILIGLAIENVFAGAASAAGVGILLAMS